MLGHEREKRMADWQMNKTTKRILIVVGILALVAVIALSLRNCSNANSVVASNPGTISEMAQNASLEAISDETVPLAGADVAQVIPLVTAEVPVTEPAPAAGA